MTDEELDLRRKISAAERARAYVEDPILVAAFEALDARFAMAWRNTAADATAQRELIWHHLQALAEVRAELTRVLEDGLLARDRLEEIRAGITNP